MDELIVKEKEFFMQLNKWIATGRSLQNLVTFTKQKSSISISLITVDNSSRLKLDKQFANYQQAFSWYGSQVDNCYGG